MLFSNRRGPGGEAVEQLDQTRGLGLDAVGRLDQRAAGAGEAGAEGDIREEGLQAPVPVVVAGGDQGILVVAQEVPGATHKRADHGDPDGHVLELLEA